MTQKRERARMVALCARIGLRPRLWTKPKKGRGRQDQIRVLDCLAVRMKEIAVEESTRFL